MRAAFLIACAAAGCADGECTRCPTATLTANGATELVARAGELIVYEWASTNADSASSAVQISPGADRCGNRDGPWVIESLRGSRDPEPLLACQTGFVYVLSFTAAQAVSGEDATAHVTISVE